MSQINANINDEILSSFRDVIYRQTGLKKGDFGKTLESAMIEYILKYSNSNLDVASRVKLLARNRTPVKS